MHPVAAEPNIVVGNPRHSNTGLIMEVQVLLGADIVMGKGDVKEDEFSGEYRGWVAIGDWLNELGDKTDNSVECRSWVLKESRVAIDKFRRSMSK